MLCLFYLTSVHGTVTTDRHTSLCGRCLELCAAAALGEGGTIAQLQVLSYGDSLFFGAHGLHKFKLSLQSTGESEIKTLSVTARQPDS